MTKPERKQSMGKRKIEIKKIEKKTALQVTFSKRRTGLFKKASELCNLCGAEVAIVVFSPSGRVFLFGQPSADAVISRFLGREGEANAGSSGAGGGDGLEQREKKGEEEGGFWWDAPIENMDLPELERFKASIEDLREKLADQVEEMTMTMVDTVSSCNHMTECYDQPHPQLHLHPHPHPHPQQYYPSALLDGVRM